MYYSLKIKEGGKSAVFCNQNDHLLFLIREIQNKMVQTAIFSYFWPEKNQMSLKPQFISSAE